MRSVIYEREYKQTRLSGGDPQHYKKLVGIKSEVNTDGEKAAAEAIHDIIKNHPYFKTNPSQLVMEQTINDERERYNVMAYVKGTKGNSNRTVVLMGHMNTVGVDDLGSPINYGVKIA